ncbi:MAG: hypothetical protein Q9220_002183 [cf. Caloplaca sp. 1 TL-2023]
MGARHQIFIIARTITGYRTLAALHHQMLYGFKATQRCLRILLILRSTHNRIPILQELRAANQFPSSFWARRSQSKEYQPFPFIATSLIIGSSYSPDAAYQERVHLSSYDVRLNEIHNNAGITVIDITTPSKPKYCFASAMKDTGPLDASTYVWRPERESECVGLDDDDEAWLEREMEWDRFEDLEEDDLLAFKESLLERRRDVQKRIREDPSVKSLEQFDLVTYSALQNWVQGLEGKEQEVDREEAHEEKEASSLRDQSMDRLIITALRDPVFDATTTEEAQQLSDFVPKFRNKLIDLAIGNNLPSPTASGLSNHFALAFSNLPSIDLSPFSQIPSDILVPAVCAFLKENKGVTAMNLSHLSLLSISDIEIIVSNCTNLSVLYLLYMPQILPQDLASLWAAPGSLLKTIHHTELLSRPLSENPTYTSLIRVQQNPVLFDAKNPIKHLFWARVIVGNRKVLQSDGTSVDWNRLGPSGVGKGDLERDPVMCSAVFPIHDTFLPSSRLVAGLVDFFRCEAKSTSHDFSGGIAGRGFTLAKAFASASFEVESGGESDAVPVIQALPPLSFETASVNTKVCNLLSPLDFPDLKDGEGAVLVINEHDEFYNRSDGNDTKFRMAIVFPILSADGSVEGFRAMSMPEYLKGVVSTSRWGGIEDVEMLARYWEERTSFVKPCGTDEANQALTAIKRCIQQSRAIDKLQWDRMVSGWNRR